MAYEFSALRPGETERTCAKCGKTFTPTSRPQKYCPACGRRRTYARLGWKAPKDTIVRRARMYNENNLGRLNDALFAELDRIESATHDELEAETSRANTVCNIASAIIANGRLVLAASQASMTTAETVSVPSMLLGGGDGK